MLKDKMTFNEMLKLLSDIGHDTFYFDSTIVQEIARTELNYEVEWIDNEIIFVKKKLK